MEYKLKGKPEKVHWEETKQFNVVDENGVEYTLRVGDSWDRTEYFIWEDGNGGWNDLKNEELIEWISESLPNEEWSLEQELRKEFEPKMDELYEKYVKENGEIKEIKKFGELVWEMQNIEGIHRYKHDYYERLYVVYHFLLKKFK
jgi:hypothetical protein